MTVNRLIEILQTCDKRLRVRILTESGHRYNDIEDVFEQSVLRDGREIREIILSSDEA